LILPSFALSAMQTAVLIRYTRSSMLDTLKQDYIRTARAKGLSGFQVIAGHALRNALLPVVTVLALHIGGLFSGAVITETVFAYQGVGKLVYDSIVANDFNVAMVAFTITISMVLVMNLAADLLYAYLDPRISYR
jgi:peptide/nickel transport system permease protein